MDLGFIPRQFPSQPVRRTFSPLNMAMTTSECDCLKQASVPPLPEEILFEPTEENREKLESWMIEWHKASAMNTCHHQRIPALSGGR